MEGSVEARDNCEKTGRRKGKLLVVGVAEAKAE
jgi:hypothetical protein